MFFDRSDGFKHGAYLAPEFVTLGSPAESIHDPAVAPDQSFIVFDAGKVKGGLGHNDLPWGSHLDPDGRTIYFTGKSGIQRFSLAPWLAAHRR